MSLHTHVSLTEAGRPPDQGCSCGLELLPDHHFDGIHTDPQPLLLGYAVGYPAAAVGYRRVKVHPPTRRWLGHYEDINLQNQPEASLCTRTSSEFPTHPQQQDRQKKRFYHLLLKNSNFLPTCKGMQDLTGNRNIFCRESYCWFFIHCVLTF